VSPSFRFSIASVAAGSIHSVPAKKLFLKNSKNSADGVLCFSVLKMTAIKKMSDTTLLLLLLLLILPASFLLSSTTAFSDESLKDLSRLPHFQRIWLQRLDQQNKKNNSVTSSSSSRPFTSSTTISSTATYTDVSSTTDESLEEVPHHNNNIKTIPQPPKNN
jgi:hypothetical protein